MEDFNCYKPAGLQSVKCIFIFSLSFVKLNSAKEL